MAWAPGGGGVAPPPAAMTLALGAEEISALREALEGYLALDVGGGRHEILDDLYGLFVLWERKGRG